VQALLIPPQPQHPSVRQVPPWPELPALQQLVGDYLDIRYDIASGWHLYCPERGMERGLALNAMATGLVRHANPAARPVYGPAVVVGTGFHGEDVNVPEDLVVNVLGGPP
jgi:hypothetical protein